MIKEPTGTLWEEHHTGAEDDSRDHLEAPGNAERRDAVDVRAAKLYKILKQDTPCDGPLLERNHTATDGGCRNFCLVDWDNGASQADGESRDDTPDDEHTTVLKCRSWQETR